MVCPKIAKKKKTRPDLKTLCFNNQAVLQIVVQTSYSAMLQMMKENYGKCEKQFELKIEISVAAALAGVFAILVNKICKIMAIFE